MPRFGTPFRNVFAAQLHCKPEGFFWRALGLYTHKFPKCSAASLTYLPRSRLDLPCLCLDLPHLRLGLPCLRLSRNSSPATGFRIAAPILKTCTVHECKIIECHTFGPSFTSLKLSTESLPPFIYGHWLTLSKIPIMCIEFYLECKAGWKTVSSDLSTLTYI